MVRRVSFPLRRIPASIEHSMKLSCVLAIGCSRRHDPPSFRDSCDRPVTRVSGPAEPVHSVQVHSLHVRLHSNLFNSTSSNLGIPSKEHPRDSYLQVFIHCFTILSQQHGHKTYTATHRGLGASLQGSRGGDVAASWLQSFPFNNTHFSTHNYIDT